MRCLDKVTALHPLTQRIVFANAPHCLFRLSLIIHHSHPHKNRQYENKGNDGEEQSAA